MKKILHYFKREVVLTVALIAALASFLLVPPGAMAMAMSLSGSLRYGRSSGRRRLIIVIGH
jgi:hypothetical protein